MDKGVWRGSFTFVGVDDARRCSWGVGSTYVAVLLHNLEELDNDLGGRADQDLTLAGLLGVVDAVEGIVQDGSADHFGGCEIGRFSNWVGR